MTRIELTTDDKAMFHSLKWYLGRGEPASTFCEPTLYERSLVERVIPIVTAWLRPDDPQRPRFQRAVDAMAAFNRIQWGRIHHAIDAFDEHGIDYRLLKGFDLATTCNPKNLPHSANDVDFLFQKPTLGKVHQILTKIGFRQGQLSMDNKVIELVEEYDGVVEDHYEVVGYIYPTVPSQLKEYKDLVDDLSVPIPQLLAREDGVLFSTRFDVHYNLDVEMDETLFWEKVHTGESEGRTLKFLDRGVKYPFMCFKCYVETRAPTARLRQFFDAAIVAVMTQDIDWDRVIHVAQTPRFSDGVFYVSWHINNLLGTEVVPQYVLDKTMPRGRRQLHQLRDFHHFGDFMPGLLGQATPIPLGL
jgi:hypothetical protein